MPPLRGGGFLFGNETNFATKSERRKMLGVVTHKQYAKWLLKINAWRRGQGRAIDSALDNLKIELNRGSAIPKATKELEATIQNGE